MNVDVAMNITLMIDDKLKAVRGKQLTSKRKQWRCVSVLVFDLIRRVVI